MRSLISLMTVFVGIGLFPSALWAADGKNSPPPVVLISVDGLRPGDVLDAKKRGLKVPNLYSMAHSGAYAVGVHGVLPTLTFPSHTTLITGASPAHHGIINNWAFDPDQSWSDWYWYASDIKIPTLWNAAHAIGLTTANVSWPASVGDNAIDANLPLIFLTGGINNHKLFRALATPGLLADLERDVGPYAEVDSGPYAKDPTGFALDENHARFAAQIMRTRRPDFMTMYYGALDHTEHSYGPDSAEAHAVLEHIDDSIGQIVHTARSLDPRSIICVVSDHGFAPLSYDINIFGIFVDAGLIRLNTEGKVVAWDAAPWNTAGSAMVLLHEPNDGMLKDRVGTFLRDLARDPKNGIERILPQDEILARGGNPDAAFFVLFKPGYMMALDPKSAPYGKSAYKGTHGYSPDAPEMFSTFMIEGQGIPRRALGKIDMRDIAPTIARLLGVSLEKAEGKSLF